MLVVGPIVKRFALKKPLYTYCHKEGHTKEKCFKFYGFSLRSKPKIKFNQFASVVFVGEHVETKAQYGFSSE